MCNITTIIIKDRLSTFLGIPKKYISIKKDRTYMGMSGCYSEWFVYIDRLYIGYISFIIDHDYTDKEILDVLNGFFVVDPNGKWRRSYIEDSHSYSVKSLVEKIQRKCKIDLLLKDNR